MATIGAPEVEIKVKGAVLSCPVLSCPRKIDSEPSYYPDENLISLPLSAIGL